MRTCLLVVAAVAALAAGAPEPQKIAYTRVFPNAGQLGLFIAAADGSDERPLLANADIDYDAVWSPDGGSIVFTSDREGSADLFRVKPDGTGARAPHRQPRLRRSGGVLAGRQAARVRQHTRERRHRRICGRWTCRRDAPRR